MTKRKTTEELWADYVSAREAAEAARALVASAVVAELEGGASELGLAKRLGCSRTVVRSMQGKRQRYPSRS